MRIEWSAYAVSDLKQIPEHIEADRSLETANRVSRTIYDTIQSRCRCQIAAGPGALKIRAN